MTLVDTCGSTLGLRGAREECRTDSAPSRRYYWFEPVELVRKLCQTSLVVCLFDGTAGQIVLTMILCDGVGSWEKREDGSYHNPATRTNEATRSALFVAGEKLEESFIKDIMERSMQVGAQQTLIELGQREDVPKQ